MKNFTKVSKRDEFLRLGLHTVAKYLSDDQLSVLREEHVYEAALRWLEVGGFLLFYFSFDMVCRIKHL